MPLPQPRKTSIYTSLLAAAAGVPFVLFDAQDPDTDRWQPLWGTPGSVTARATEAIKFSIACSSPTNPSV